MSTPCHSLRHEAVLAMSQPRPRQCLCRDSALSMPVSEPVPCHYLRLASVNVMPAPCHRLRLASADVMPVPCHRLLLVNADVMPVPLLHACPRRCHASVVMSSVQGSLAITPACLGLAHCLSMAHVKANVHLDMSFRIPLVRTSSELAIQRAWKAPKGTVPSPSPDRHAATRSRRGSSSSSPPTADGFGTWTPVPNPQSQSFSRSYGSIFPTSLAYIVPSTRGCSPWRPDTIMSTTGRGRHSVLRIFKGRRERSGHHTTCGALPAAGPYLRLSRFQGGQAVK
ncbi:hypothetical protein CQW23_35088 [Capsicum baccatum]|uniref:Protein TAR1 n=1 Tax=Capsicum baccatum TaxID=33114 RepID=A0A2G2UXB9_CAPBA|nr:hypothetical protein CQW23_35088 [Capsicum baccatum]